MKKPKIIEPMYQKLIDRILEASSAPLPATHEEAKKLKSWHFIFQPLDDYELIHARRKNTSTGHFMYSGLCPNSLVNDKRQSLPKFDIESLESSVDFTSEHSKQNKDIPIYFERTYPGYTIEKEHYIELNQKISFALGVHWSRERQSYCTLNRSGKEVEIVKVIETDDITLVLIRKKSLDRLLHEHDVSLVRYFEYFLMDKNHVTRGEGEKETPDSIIRIDSLDIKYKVSSFNHVQFIGGQIIKPSLPKEEVLDLSYDELDEYRGKYESFIIQDIKNNFKILEDYSIDPKNLANYFTKNSLLSTTSPVFFDAEVLDKYKNNPDKYELNDRTISCRGGWYLKSYDINEYGQVHTYAIYLSGLPYREQLYWKSFNEKPKGGISKRAFDVDFMAEFPDEEYKLRQLEKALHDLKEVEILGVNYCIWKPKGGSWKNASKGLFYVQTKNAKEWHDFIIYLANASIEGLQSEDLGRIAKKIGIHSYEPGKSLNLIKEILKKLRLDDCNVVHRPMKELQRARGSGKVHGGWKTPQGSLVEDANRRLEEITRAFKMLKSVLQDIKFEEQTSVKSPSATLTSKKTKKKVTKSINKPVNDLDRRRELGRLYMLKGFHGPSHPKVKKEVRKYIGRFGEEPYI